MKFFNKAIKDFLCTVIIFCGAFLFVNFFLLNVSTAQISHKKNSDISLNEFSLFTEDSLKKKANPKKPFKMKKEPWKAVAYSAVLPGAGQFYNESYWKIPVIWGLGGYFVYELIDNNNSYLDYKDQYLNSQTPENPDGNLSLKSLRDFYKDQRDNFIIYSVILYVVNLIDAYVDAQLYDFDVSDKLKISLNAEKRNLGFKFVF